MGFCSKGLQNKFETAMVNEPSLFEPLKFYCNWLCQPKFVIVTVQIFQKAIFGLVNSNALRQLVEEIHYETELFFSIAFILTVVCLN